MTSPLDEQVALLRSQVNDLVTRFTDVDGSSAGPINWLFLDADRATEAWAGLTGWVDWLLERYRLTETVPGCWYTHPPILEELSALHAAWLGAYHDANADSSVGVIWHDALERVTQRISELDLSGCATSGTHRPEVTVPANPMMLAARTDAIRDDIAHRPRPAPQPDEEDSTP
jgi:hypothetical protein